MSTESQVRPHLAPAHPQDCDASVQQLLSRVPRGADGEIPRVFTTLAHHGPLFAAWLPFAAQLLTHGTLPARVRELLILRTAWLCGAEYEWGHHVVIALQAGLSEDEISRISAGEDAGWGPADALLLRAADELHTASRLSDDTWSGLSESFEAAELIELVLLVGQYHLVAFALNSLGVQLEPGYPPLPVG